MSITILNGDCRTTLAALPEKSVQCCITSPPYFGLRDYNVAGQIGLEPTPDEYVREMVAVFVAVKRVLKDDGVLWLNIGDCYAGSGKGAWNAPEERKGAVKETYRPVSDAQRNSARTMKPGMDRNMGFKQKDLMLIPWRVAMALQADGWYLRAACPWIKRNGMPDSTKDRPTQCVETMFMFTNSRSCYYDAEAVKKECSANMKERAAKGHTRGAGGKVDDSRCDSQTLRGDHVKSIDVSNGRLRRTSDWFFESWQGLLLDSDDEPSAFVVNLKGYKEAHFATFPPKLIEPCVLSSTSEKGECPDCGKAWVRIVEKTTIPDPSYNGSAFDTGKTAARDGGERTQSGDRFLKCTTGWRPQCTCGKGSIPQVIIDPFGGSGTTAEVARMHGRSSILCELNANYVTLMHKRLGMEPQPLCLDE